LVFDHVTLRVAQLAWSREFYDLVFKALDYSGAAYADGPHNRH
jgi:hypothetical protein